MIPTSLGGERLARQLLVKCKGRAEGKRGEKRENLSNCRTILHWCDSAQYAI